MHVRDAMGSALGMMRAKEWDGALKVLYDVHNVRQDDAMVVFLMGTCHRMLGHNGLAHTLYLRAMELKEEFRIPAPREAVFAALNDPKVLAAAIPGCESLEQTSDNAFAATVVSKIGPIKARFQGEVTLSDIVAPESYTISGEGKAGPAGFAKGSARVHLTEDGGETVLTYEVSADVGGKIAQLGGRLIESTSKKLAGKFFQDFEKIVVEQAGEVPAEEVAEFAPAFAFQKGVPAKGLWIALAFAGIGLAAYLLLK